MAELFSDEEREGEALASPLRSGSTDWEMVPSTSSSPVLPSRDELSGMEIGEVHGLPFPAPAHNKEGFVQDDYFGWEADYSESSPGSHSMSENNIEGAPQVEIPGFYLDSHYHAETALPLFPVSSDSGSIYAAPTPLLSVERDDDVSLSSIQPQGCCTEDTRIDSGSQSPRRDPYQDIPALQPLSIPGLSTDFIDPRTSASSATPTSDVDSSGQLARVAFEGGGGQDEVVNDSETLDLIPGEDNTRDNIGVSRHIEGGLSERDKRPAGDCWLQRQLCAWQARLGQAKTLCSVTLAAAIVGILILGRGWQRLRDQNRVLLLQLYAKDKRITQLMFQLLQMKESLSKTRQIPVIRSKPALQIPQERS